MSLKELLSRWTYQVFAPGTLLRKKYNAFREILELDVRNLELLASLEEIYTGSEAADWHRVARLCRELADGVGDMARLLHIMAPMRSMGLEEYVKKIGFYIDMGLDTGEVDIAAPYCLPLDETAHNPHLAGGKAEALGRLAAETDIPVPPGFVITTTAFNFFIESNDLRQPIAEVLGRIELGDAEALAGQCADIQALIRQSPVPEDIIRAISEQLASLPAGQLAVRSSALAEDGEASFAGVYESVIGVEPDGLTEAYKSVLMGKYSPQAVTYRILKGLCDEETAMAVVVQPRITVRSAGVMYTTDEDATQCVQGVATIYSVKGMGESLVSGRAKPDLFCLTKEDTPHVLLRPPHFDSPGSETLLELARIADKLESFFKTPQDVEWAVDTTGTLHILQSRPLNRSGPIQKVPHQPAEGVAPVLADGVRISSGAASGTIVRTQAGPPEAVEPGTILVTEALTPDLARHLDSLAGVISRIGSRAGHFASVSREFGLPVMVADDTDVLKDGMTVTMDATTGQVYPGRLAPLVTRAPVVDRRSSCTTERLGKIMQHISILSLTDPEADDFTPEGCKSMHDVIRFCHEISLNEMFSLVSRTGRGLGRVKKLKSGLPIVLYVLDLGGGLFDSVREAKSITPEDIVSKPMWAAWWGLSKSGASWDEKLLHVDWEEFDRISGGIFGKESKILASYAIVAEDYTHLLLRFGYHFTVLDAVCGGQGTNHISFRFKGGGGEWDQRINRLTFLTRTLQAKGFTTSSKGDMLTAQFDHGTENETRHRLVFLGRLMAHTRMLDMKLPNREAAVELSDRFLEQDAAANGG